jgi:hypothetical protein
MRVVKSEYSLVCWSIYYTPSLWRLCVYVCVCVCVCVCVFLPLSLSLSLCVRACVLSHAHAYTHTPCPPPPPHTHTPGISASDNRRQPQTGWSDPQCSCRRTALPRCPGFTTLFTTLFTILFFFGRLPCYSHTPTLTHTHSLTHIQQVMRRRHRRRGLQ